VRRLSIKLKNHVTFALINLNRMNIQDELRKIPGVDVLLKDDRITHLLDNRSRAVVIHLIKQILDDARAGIQNGEPVPTQDQLVERISSAVSLFTRKSLRPVINATGVIVHTNLGRAPFGDILLDEVNNILRSYNNIEFDLDEAERGSRYTHVTALMKYLTGAEDVLIVNNNAAAVMLVLRSFAKSREVVISRSELIEIGGAFRMPDIMAASDCKMVEVGTTNKTKISDYEAAINENTAILLKAHKSNYVIIGFTDGPSLDELAQLGTKTGKMVVYDMGSGLLRKANVKLLKDEPDVRSTLSKGVDLVTFSGDKLLGGPQAGIIAGKKHLIDRLKKEPLTRAVRVGKTVLALLEAVCLAYLDEETLLTKSPVFQMMSADLKALTKRAVFLSEKLKAEGISSRVVSSFGQAGGGALPGKTIESRAVQPDIDASSRAVKTARAELIYRKLLKQELPVLGVLRKGNLLFDVLTIPESDLNRAAETITTVFREVIND
jgi:L-seryl-tRNA(Ser) seleniumtransferase